jgi:hypothetical protein
LSEFASYFAFYLAFNTKVKETGALPAKKFKPMTSRIASILALRVAALLSIAQL